VIKSSNLHTCLALIATIALTQVVDLKKYASILIPARTDSSWEKNIIAKVVQTVYFHIRWLCQIRNSLSFIFPIILPNSLVFTNLDYCNSPLLNLSDSSIIYLPLANGEQQCSCHCPTVHRHHHITLTLTALFLLHICKRIHYKQGCSCPFVCGRTVVYRSHYKRPQFPPKVCFGGPNYRLQASCCVSS